MSTVSPQASRTLAAWVHSLGASMLDAPVSGSVPAAGDGTLTILAGGAASAFDAVQPLPAQRGGVDPDLAVAAMAASAIGSPMLKARAPLVLDLPARPWFDMELMHKDIRPALDAARHLHVPLPSAAVSDDELARAEELGYGRRDIAGLFEALSATPWSAAPWSAAP
jgi:3-hydroxyisobutyrate dehydrogenase-like beta-hydroxyacid dehydrogenase